MSTSRVEYQFKISDESLKKVYNYLLDEVKKNNSREITMTITDLSKNSDTSVATCHKVLKQLELQGDIDIVLASSRRFPNTYIFKRDVETLKKEVEERDEIEALREQVKTAREEIINWREKYNDIKNDYDRLVLENEDLRRKSK